ncbi:SDR family oxidoreductase [Massilia pinisoli]|uniref:SDR family oxidoreductase n=1 Tax=Massilia pinisoli TaxID=1772194 RepID=A0ABT1ZZU4_9BURK|nr:SDR family oxidoreductase [Massilia pinisoli]
MRTTQQLFDLTGRTALVTGGSRGLGLQMATALGEMGARVVLSARKQAELDAAVEQLGRLGIAASAIAADMASESGVAGLAAAALERLGHVDILVNNAGATWAAPAEDYPLEAWDKVMNLNVRSIFLLSQAVGRQSMIPRRQGRIINVASIAGFAGNAPDSPMKTLAYNTSKAALMNFTRTLAGEWGVHGITVNAIAPGYFPSKMTTGLLQQAGEENLTKSVPLHRLGDDEDLKGVAAFLASDAAKHVTGQVIAVDGGNSAVR